MTNLMTRQRGGWQTPTIATRREAILYAAHDEELTDTQTKALWIHYGFGVATTQDFLDLFAELRTLVERHTDLTLGCEKAAAEYGMPPEAALVECENDVFKVLGRLVPSLRAVS